MRTLVAIAVVLFASTAHAEVQIVSIGPPRPKPAALTPAPSPVPAPQARVYYPVADSYRWSGCNGWWHLNEGPHRGKFDVVWLQEMAKLPDGMKRLRKLHDDHHDELKYGRAYVQWDKVVRASNPVSKLPSNNSNRTSIRTDSNCPAGTVCPTSSSRPGLLQGLLGIGRRR